MLIRVDLCDQDYENLVKLAKEAYCPINQMAGYILGVAIVDRASGRQADFEDWESGKAIERIRYLIDQPVMGTA